MTNGIPVLQESDNVISLLTDSASYGPAKFGFSEEEFNSLRTQNRVLRCWYYIRLLDAFRNVPFSVSYDDPSKNSMARVPPEFIFNFVETELKESIPLLYKKESLGSGSQYANLWTQGRSGSFAR